MVFTAWLKINSHSQFFRYGQSIFYLPRRPKFLDFFDLCLNWVSIYSWSIGHILEHEFFCLGCLGWAGSKEKKSGFEFFWATFEGVFSNFLRAKNFFFFWKHCRKFPHFFGIFDDFVYCWTLKMTHFQLIAWFGQTLLGS